MTRARRRPRSAAPRAKVQLGSAQVNASDLAGLRRAWQARELVLCLGAGVSMPYGLPSWNNLLLELLFEQAQGTRRLKPLLPHYRRAVAAWMTDYFDYDPLVLARMVERDLGEKNRARGRCTPGSSEPTFLERLRTHLYANYRPRRGPTTLKAVADLIAEGTKTCGVAAVLSFNFDDLLERELARRKVRCEPVADPTRRRGPGLRISTPTATFPAAAHSPARTWSSPRTTTTA